ncbi:MAG: hypothetical protein PHX38_02780 [Sulfuricella sp.]|nr:hypothetical protein [Sulfuricella sp.]
MLVVGVLIWRAKSSIAAAIADPVGTAEKVATGAIDLAGGMASGTVIGVGQAVGIPATNKTPPGWCGACSRPK